MKRLSYVLLASVLVAALGCKKNENPYVGYLTVERAVVNAAGGSATVTVDTDISSPVEVTIPAGAPDWVSASVNGMDVTVTATKPNPGETFRTANVTVRCGYRTTTLIVLQKYDGQEYLLHDWTGWTASGSDVQADDGGGYPSLFTEDRSTFWHSRYSPALTTPLPHTIVIDMKKELSVSMVSIGRRYYPGNGNNYATVKAMDIYTGSGPGADEITEKVGGFRFDLPWTAPDGTVVTGQTNPLIPGFEEVILDKTTTARYVKLVITEVNPTTSTNGACQVSFFKAYEKI